MEGDAMHAMIEKQLKNKVMNVPAEYTEVCRKARRNPALHCLLLNARHVQEI